MDSRVEYNILIVFFLCFLLLSHAEGDSTWELSRKQEFQFEQQLLNLKKSAIKSIQTDGDIYDCIDFYKQPGFSHPFWKNTPFQTKRKLFMEAMKTNVSLPLSFGLKDGGCPYGTVPIMRIDEDGLTRAKMSSKLYLTEPGHHYAILQTKPDLTKKIEGIQASFSCFNAKGIDGSQYSSFRMTLSNNLDSIKTGLTVNPLLFKDNKTRIFTHVVMDGRTQCFNYQCPGYIHLNPQIPLGNPINHVSVVGGDQQYATKLQVRKEYINTTELGWTLRVEENIVLGFWPTTIFNKLREFGNYADWGGEVYSPLDQPSPAMGTGIRPRGYQWSTANSAHSRFVAIIYEDFQSEFERPSYVDTKVYESDPKTYTILNIGHRKKMFGDYLILYDGPGGITSN
ncbi:hypothetical protein I3760_12G105800 [Carya illinoinensis]|nr:hypothetical protein I3760_12G105800 [Carya illinoinensis]